jgi:hypothetical protein
MAATPAKPAESWAAEHERNIELLKMQNVSNKFEPYYPQRATSQRDQEGQQPWISDGEQSDELWGYHSDDENLTERLPNLDEDSDFVGDMCWQNCRNNDFSDDLPNFFDQT